MGIKLSMHKHSLANRNSSHNYCMKKTFFSCFLSLIVFTVNAQKKKEVPCPTVSVSCADMVSAGDTTYFSASVSGGDAKVDPTFNWTISNGTIMSGQGTSAIAVSTEGLTGTVTATLDVGGYARECATSNSCTFSIKPGAVKYITSHDFAFDKIDARMKEFMAASNWKNTYPQPVAFVYFYPGKSWSKKQYTRNRIDVGTALQRYGIDVPNFKIVDGPKQKKGFYEIYLLPEGAT